MSKLRVLKNVEKFIRKSFEKREVICVDISLNAERLRQNSREVS